MDFISINQAPAFITLISGALLVGAGVTLAEFIKRRRPRVETTLVIVGVLTFLASILVMAAATNAQRAAAADGLNELYGLHLTADDAEDLGYPMDKPAKASEIFGSTTVKVDGGWQQVTLVWENDVFLLVNTNDAGPGRELERR